MNANFASRLADLLEDPVRRVRRAQQTEGLARAQAMANELRARGFDWTKSPRAAKWARLQAQLRARMGRRSS